MAIPTITELEAELTKLVKSVPVFAESGFSVFDIDDFAAKAAGQTLPVVGIAYDGAEPAGNEAVPVAKQAQGSSLISIQFLIVIAVEYRYTGQDDTKQEAFALLHQTRAVVLGFKGVNSRPWRFIGEGPELAASGDGVAFYSQVWQTTLPIVGKSNNL